MFDLIVVLIILISAAVGFLRGAAREVATVVAFVLAVLLAVFALRFTGPLSRGAIHPAWLGNVVAVLVIFIAAYILLRVLGSSLTRRIHETEALGAFDRLIGLGFGLIRAGVLLGVFNLVFNIATPAERTPKWVSEAKTYPLTEICARALRTLAPQGSALASKVAPALEKAVQDGAKPGDNEAEQGYDAANPNIPAPKTSSSKGPAPKGIDDLLENQR